MLGDLLRAVAQLDERRTRSCIWQSILAGIAAFIALVLGAQLLIGAFGETGYVWLDWAINIVGIAGASVLAWLVFPMVFSVTIGFFADRVCDAVEARHFPGLPPARPVPLTESIVDGVRLAGLAILLNLLALPLYLMPGPNIVIYLALNGYLLDAAESGAAMAELLHPKAPPKVRELAVFESEYPRSLSHLYPALEAAALARGRVEQGE